MGTWNTYYNQTNTVRGTSPSNQIESISTRYKNLYNIYAQVIFHSDTLGPVLAGMICICCLLSGCRMQARTEMFPSKEGYLVTIGEDPTDRDTRWAKYLYEHLKKRANDDEIVAFGVSEMDMWRIIIQIDPTLQRGFKVRLQRL